MKLSHLIASGALALGAWSAFAAGGPLDLSTGSDGFQSTPTAGGFSDIFTFTLGAASVATSSLTSVVSGNQDVDFTSISLVGPAGFFSFTQLLPDPVEVWALSSAVLTPGSYQLIVSGTSSAGIGSYGGNFAVTPVPEPETLALMFAGLGAVGFVARRRKVAA